MTLSKRNQKMINNEKEIIHMYIYIYICIEREIDTYICIYIYICIYVYRIVLGEALCPGPVPGREARLLPTCLSQKEYKHINILPELPYKHINI